MITSDILAGINEEIARLQQVRHLLTGHGHTNGKGYAATKPRKKRFMSAEARERIAAAQRKRWAKQKKAAK